MGSGRPRSVCVIENTENVEDLVLSQEDNPTKKSCCRRETARCRRKFWSIPSLLALCWSNISQSNAVSQWMHRVCINTVSEEAEHVLPRLTYLLAYCTLLLQFTLCPMRDLAEAYYCRLMSFHSASWIWIWIIIANLLTDISAMGSFICWDNILLFISLC